ncbi:epoxide hydrolase [Cylindrobasidium torrendii FP15055 ss-10]|uniref:Epoxide hydrolase n=1 Tax=Cylindrobasidium torrendii FP15055 ss-10 TaxID=1314674 RepID=A0A0D7B632_9AGAR|nr:epoxide hydrolase [Cylindrobasidium torrendii FP15055 ss-10]
MDTSSERTTVVSRGFTYHYYASPAAEGKPTLLLIHGFPNLATDWKNQWTFFKQLGFGLIAPDIIGFGGSSKTEEPLDYRHTLIARDLVDVLDAEKVVEPVFAIGHDWGVLYTSRLADLFPERFAGFAFLAVGYMYFENDDPAFFEGLLKMSKEKFGYETYGYQKFLATPEAANIITEHWDSFMRIQFAKDPSVWIDDFAPLGAMERALLADHKPEFSEWMDTKEAEYYRKTFLEGNGIAGPLMLYTIIVEGIASRDNKENVGAKANKITKPVFFGGTAKDYVNLPDVGEAAIKAASQDVTVHRYDTGHWVHLDASKELNRDLLAWIQAKA